MSQEEKNSIVWYFPFPKKAQWWKLEENPKQKDRD